jgi:hypothetical protein
MCGPESKIENDVKNECNKPNPYTPMYRAYLKTLVL